MPPRLVIIMPPRLVISMPPRLVINIHPLQYATLTPHTNACKALSLKWICTAMCHSESCMHALPPSHPPQVKVWRRALHKYDEQWQETTKPQPVTFSKDPHLAPRHAAGAAAHGQEQQQQRGEDEAGRGGSIPSHGGHGRGSSSPNDEGSKKRQLSNAFMGQPNSASTWPLSACEHACSPPEEGPPSKQPTPTNRGSRSSPAHKDVMRHALGQIAEEQKDRFRGWADDGED